MRTLMLLLAVSLGAAVLASPVSADPTHAKNATQIHALCGTRTVDVVVNGGNGNGTFQPAHVVGSTSVFVPTALHLTFGFTPTGGTTSFDTTDATKASPPKRGSVTCTTPLQTLFSGPQGTGTIQGSVTGFFTPAR